LDYTIDGVGVNVHFEWDNPAVGGLFIKFDPPTANGGPSDFVFFATGIDIGTGEARAVTQTLQGDPDNFVFPVPFGPTIPNARFHVGIRNKRDPVSARRWRKAIRLDPTKGIRVIQLRPLSMRKLVELEF
jgi:hypothetical protein